jgi:hypothetical protein
MSCNPSASGDPATCPAYEKVPIALLLFRALLNPEKRAAK